MLWTRRHFWGIQKQYTRKEAGFAFLSAHVSAPFLKPFGYEVLKRDKNGQVS